LLEQLDDLEHVFFGQLHQPLSCGRRRVPLTDLDRPSAGEVSLRISTTGTDMSTMLPGRRRRPSPPSRKDRSVNLLHHVAEITVGINRRSCHSPGIAVSASSHLFCGCSTDQSPAVICG
jgi:hypothetical protein